MTSLSQPIFLTDVDGDGFQDIFGISEDRNFAPFGDGTGRFTSLINLSDRFTKVQGWSNLEESPRFIGNFGKQNRVADLFGLKDGEFIQLPDVASSSKRTLSLS